ncbi:MAG TPA: hypothetical protein VFB36_12335 [Nevskiaceae bacterium]|nr:hypothetical protein [Nevskiaceae bacterium]
MTRHLDERHEELTAKLQRDRVALIRAAQGLQPQLRALDRAEHRVRIAAEALPVIAWAAAELLLAAVAVRRLSRRQRTGWLSLLLQVWRGYQFLRGPAAPSPVPPMK